LDEHLGLVDLIARYLIDSLRRKNAPLLWADFLRQSAYSRVVGCEGVNDTYRLLQDPTFRLNGSEKVRKREAALTSRL